MANETAKVVRFHTLGGPEVLKIQEEPIPEPGKGEVRLNVKAIGLNRAEVMFRRVNTWSPASCRQSSAMKRPV